MAGTMKARQTQDTGMRDAFVWSVIALLLIGGIYANYHYNDYALSIRFIGWMALTAIVVSLSVLTEKGKSAKEFINDARMEVRKVVWPDRQTTVRMTMIVALMVFVASIILWVMDLVAIKVVAAITAVG